jgi:hypothetical protein
MVSAKSSLGDYCTTNVECTSNFCSQGVCRVEKDDASLKIKTFAKAKKLALVQSVLRNFITKDSSNKLRAVSFQTAPDATATDNTTETVADTTTPSADTTTPVDNTTTPAVDNTTTPAAENSTTPADNSTTPVADNSTKPIDNTTDPVADNSTKPVDNTTDPVADNSTKPVDNTTAPVVTEEIETLPTDEHQFKD